MTEGYNTERVRVKWYIETGYVGGTHEDVWIFPPGELPNDPVLREELLDAYLENEIANYIEAGYSIEGE